MNCPNCDCGPKLGVDFLPLVEMTGISASAMAMRICDSVAKEARRIAGVPVTEKSLIDLICKNSYNNISDIMIAEHVIDWILAKRTPNWIIERTGGSSKMKEFNDLFPESLIGSLHLFARQRMEKIGSQSLVYNPYRLVGDLDMSGGLFNYLKSSVCVPENLDAELDIELIKKLNHLSFGYIPWSQPSNISDCAGVKKGVYRNAFILEQNSNYSRHRATGGSSCLAVGFHGVSSKHVKDKYVEDWHFNRNFACRYFPGSPYGSYLFVEYGSGLIVVQPEQGGFSVKLTVVQPEFPGA